MQGVFKMTGTASWSRILFYILAGAVIIFANVARFTALDQAPPGLHPDEAIDSVTLQCIASNGMKDPLAPNPWFVLMGYSFKPPTYIYPGIVWVNIFGSSAVSIRAYAGFFVLLTIIGLFVLGRRLFGVSYGMWVALLASVSSWIWPVSRFGNDSLCALPFLVWGLYFFLRSNSFRDMGIAAFLLVGSLYGYSTYRMAVPLALPLLFFYKWRFQGLRLWPSVFFVGVFAVTLIPLVELTLRGSLSQYFNEISIFNKDFLSSIGKTNSFADLWSIYWKIYFMHLTPAYLFFNGGGSVMYLTGFGGLLGCLDILGLLAGIGWVIRLAVVKKAWLQESKYVPFILVFLAAFFIGISPAGVTQYNVPSVMRISAAWPFAMMFCAFFLWRGTEKLRWSAAALTILGVVVFYAYLQDYFAHYAKKNYGDFQARYQQMAESAKNDVDWAKFIVACRGQTLTARYYLMHYRGLTCDQADKFHANVSNFIRAQEK